jgi:hypothetical protein
MANLKAGDDYLDFTGLGRAIEEELNELLVYADMDPLPTDDPDAARDRRRLFAAIARGVLRHLRDNPDAFQVVFTEVASPHETWEFSAHIVIDADVD